MQASVGPLQEWAGSHAATSLTCPSAQLKTGRRVKGPPRFSSLTPHPLQSCSTSGGPSIILESSPFSVPAQPHVALGHLVPPAWHPGFLLTLPGLLCSQPSLMVPTRVKAQFLRLTTCPLVLSTCSLFQPQWPRCSSNTPGSSASGPFCNSCSLCLERYPPQVLAGLLLQLQALFTNVTCSMHLPDAPIILLGTCHHLSCCTSYYLQ